MEFNLAQELASIYQDLLFLVFLELRKAYDTVDRERLLITLEGYGAGPCLCGLTKTLWDCQWVVPRQNGFHGLAFPATRFTMQGGHVCLMLFNVMVDDVVITWLAMTVEDQSVAHDGLGEIVGKYLGLFYANDDMSSSRNTDWMQHEMDILVGLFIRYGLAANVAK